MPLGTTPFEVPFSMEGRLRVPLEVAECRKLGRGEAWGAALVYVRLGATNPFCKMRNLKCSKNEEECDREQATMAAERGHVTSSATCQIVKLSNCQIGHVLSSATCQIGIEVR